MRELQWESVHEALASLEASDADFRVRDLARQVLEVYDEQWPAGEIYRHYRSLER